MCAFEQSLLIHKKSIYADLSQLEPVRDEWETFLHEHQLNQEELEGWRLVFTEAVVNAIVHGAENDPTKEINLSWWRKENTLCLEVTDPGKGVDFEAVKDPQLPEDPYDDHGRGLFIIHQFCDVWEHWKGPNAYRQILKKSSNSLAPIPDFDPVLEEALNEITLCYESLAAFYRLGESLIRSDCLGEFIQKALGDLGPLVQGDKMGIAFDIDSLQPVLREDLLGLEVADQSLLTQSKKLKNLLEMGGEWVWESFAESKEDSVLQAFGCGWCRSIQAGNKVLGVFYIARSAETPHFNAAQLNSLRTFTDLFGIAIAQANNAISREREQQALRELEIAADLQNKLFPLPQLPTDSRWTLSLKKKPARQVGGDYIDALIAPSGDLVLVMVDVMGKGVSAAFLAAVIRTALRMNLSLGCSLESLIHNVNQLLCEEIGDLTMFATCAICWVFSDMKRMHLMNAGHCPIVLCNRSGSLEQIEPSGPPLGLFKDVSYELEERFLKGDEFLYLLTDGLYEWPLKGLPWDWQNLLHFMENEQLFKNPEFFWDKLQEKIKYESDSGEATDDQSLLCWHFLPS